MRLQYMKESALSELRAHAEANLESYKADKSFISKFFKGRDDWLCDSALQISSLPKLLPGNKGSDEAENAINLHKALSGITESQASDERLWAWLAHDVYWAYMRSRWSVDKSMEDDLKPIKPVNFVREHYFIGGNVRNLVRHGIARLWWFAHMTYDPSRVDPYELTKIMLELSDTRQSLLERSFSRNRPLVRAILDRAHHWEKQGQGVVKDRARFRTLCKEINLHGGVVQLDILSQSDWFELIDSIVIRTAVSEQTDGEIENEEATSDQ